MTGRNVKKKPHGITAGQYIENLISMIVYHTPADLSRAERKSNG